VWDWVITGGTVFDGTRAEPRRVDVAVAGGEIAAVADGLPVSASRHQLSLTAQQVVVPGFIDTHSHSDFSILAAPDCPSAVAQGITTQVIGQCGFSAAPLASAEALDEEDPISGFPEVARTWRSFAEFRALLREHSPAINVVPFVGHNTLRRKVCRAQSLGDNPSAELTAALERELRRAITEGARGFSTGLSYSPGRFSSDAEVSALVAAAAAEGVPYHTHMRYEAELTSDSLASALAIAAAAGAPRYTISHVYPRYWSPVDEAERILRQFDRVRESADATSDVPPHTTGFTPWTHCLPAWAVEGGHAALLRRLGSTEERARIVAFLESAEAPRWAVQWDRLTISKVALPEHRSLLGRTIAEVAEERETAPASTALDLVMEDGHFWVSPPNKRQADLDALLAHEAYIPESDSMTVDPQRHAALGVLERSIDTFPHFLAEYAHRRKVLSFGDALRKTSAEGGRRLGLHDRGLLVAGAAADLVVLEPNALGAPRQGYRVSGVHHVMVNGAWVVVEGLLTGARPGQVL